MHMRIWTKGCFSPLRREKRNERASERASESGLDMQIANHPYLRSRHDDDDDDVDGEKPFHN